MSCAIQRFASILEALVNFMFFFEGIMMMLATLDADNGDSSGWARGLLQFIYGDVENMYSLALTAEFVASARKTVKGFEERKAYGLSIVLTALKIRALKDELDMLFKTRDSGSVRIPFAMSPEYTNGFVQLMERAAVLTESTALVSEHCGRLLLFRPACQPADLQKYKARALGSMGNVHRLFIHGIAAEFDNSLGMAFEPFELQTWSDVLVDWPKLEKVLQPVALVIQEDCKVLACQLRQAVPTAQRIHNGGHTSIDETWMLTMRHLGGSFGTAQCKPWTALGKGVGVLRSVWGSNSAAEQNFTHFQAYVEDRKASRTMTHARDLMKMKLDGPSADSSQCRKSPELPGICRVSCAWPLRTDMLHSMVARRSAPMLLLAGGTKGRTSEATDRAAGEHSWPSASSSC